MIKKITYEITNEQAELVVEALEDVARRKLSLVEVLTKQAAEQTADANKFSDLSDIFSAGLEE
jgi:hypothetical protein